MSLENEDISTAPSYGAYQAAMAAFAADPSDDNGIEVVKKLTACRLELGLSVGSWCRTPK